MAQKFRVVQWSRTCLVLGKLGGQGILAVLKFPVCTWYMWLNLKLCLYDISVTTAAKVIKHFKGQAIGP